MGFFSWLFRRKNKEVLEDTQETSTSSYSAPTPKEKPELAGTIKPKYKKVPRTAEMTSYVNLIKKKAESQDPPPHPYKGETDTEPVKKFVDKLQGRQK